MSPSPALTDLALRVAEFFRRPGTTTAARQLVESYLEEREQGTVGSIPFPTNRTTQISEGIDRDPVPTQAQSAVALVAFHDVYCDGVERIIPVPSTLPPLGEAPPAEMPALLHVWQRAAAWEAIRDRVRNLGDYAVPWFTLQLRRLEQVLVEHPRPTGRVSADTPPTQSTGKATAAHQGSTPVESPLATIWFHHERQYSMDGKTPLKVSEEFDSILQAFLEAQAAMETSDIQAKAGVTNPSRAMKDLAAWNDGVFAGAIRIPKGKAKGGYFVRVQRL
jgi:hypothetical protein